MDVSLTPEECDTRQEGEAGGMEVERGKKVSAGSKKKKQKQETWGKNRGRGR